MSKIKTVNSLSGGKTSSYMAIHYPADHNVFSVVCIEDKKCTPKDSALVKYVSDKLDSDFIATVESDKTLIVMMELEQKLGKSIDWVSGKTFEQVIKHRKFLPNMMMRFCTSDMKLDPIFNFCRNNVADVVNMNIGFRFDEKERGERNKDNTHYKTIIGKTKNGKQNKWGNIYWRELNFPLIDDHITNYEVIKWSKSSGLVFPEDSNCVGCFWKPVQQLRKNWEDEPLKMQWFSDQEQKMNKKFKKEMSYKEIKKVGLQQSFFFGTGSGCQAGFCTD
jgi:hypothetical protein